MAVAEMAELIQLVHELELLKTAAAHVVADWRAEQEMKPKRAPQWHSLETLAYLVSETPTTKEK